MNPRTFVGLALLLGTTACPVAPFTEANCPLTQSEWSAATEGKSPARAWNEMILVAIRRDTPAPTSHARNLFHTSAAMYDAWSAYGSTSDGLFFRERIASTSPDDDRTTAIDFAAFRVLSQRYAKATQGDVSLACFRKLMTRRGHNPDDDATTGDAPSAVGNRVAKAVLDASRDDGSNQANGYADTTGFVSANEFLNPFEFDAGTVRDALAWQPLNIPVGFTQNGVPSNGPQKFVGVNWMKVTPFALVRPSPGALYVDPGPAPTKAELVPMVVEVIRLNARLGASASDVLDISPGAYGNNSLGTNDGKGRPLNPITGQPYASQIVRAADFGRVLAEYWADGPRSETPPGHWNVIANQVADASPFPKKLLGADVDALEWDVKVYLALNGALHDAAIAAWELKRRTATSRPITMIRVWAYELPPTGDFIRAGTQGAQVRSWLPEVERKDSRVAVEWVDASTWWPYQLRTFVTPAFPGYVSGHSTFSRAAAEVLTGLTGSAFFPGGLGEFVAKKNAFLTFEPGPSEEIRLQYATYFDAADMAGQSRLWGGIHVAADDFAGRRVGSTVGRTALARALEFFDGSAVP